MRSLSSLLRWQRDNDKPHRDITELLLVAGASIDEKNKVRILTPTDCLVLMHMHSSEICVCHTDEPGVLCMRRPVCLAQSLPWTIIV